MNAPPDKAARTLTVATWNVHYGIGRDNRFDMARVLAVIAETDADIIGLQEVGWHRPNHERLDHFAYLREKSGYEVIEGLVRDPLRTRFGNAILSRLPVEASRWIDLKVPGHPPRAALLADLALAEAGLRVIVTHLGLVPWERAIQARRLIEAAAEDKPPGRPSLLLGDFNIWRPQTQTSRLLAARFPRCVALPSYPAGKAMVSLDRIYLSPSLKLEGARVIDQGPASLASDHLPVVATVSLAAAPAGETAPAPSLTTDVAP